uniref:DUF1643 domain-containing protein n=1 Tax=uncultured Sphingomonas sp. TaxID=158754 RepID=UPI0035C9B487
MSGDLFSDAAPRVHKDALISDCGQYRYWLTRSWDLGAYLLPIIMLNPSTADAVDDDRTIGRCMEFARREGFGGIRVVNLFAYRATAPEAMKAAADPVGPEGAAWINRTLHFAAEGGYPVLAAWGAHGSYRDRAAAVAISAKAWGAELVCLGTTKDGHPRHPLYVRGDQPFLPLSPHLQDRDDA